MLRADDVQAESCRELEGHGTSPVWFTKAQPSVYPLTAIATQPNPVGALGTALSAPLAISVVSGTKLPVFGFMHSDLGRQTDQHHIQQNVWVLHKRRRSA